MSTATKTKTAYMVLCRLGRHWLVYSDKDGEQVHGSFNKAHQICSRLESQRAQFGQKVYEDVQVIEVSR